LRVSVIPGEYGEEAVMRILNPATIALNVADLGIRADLYERIVNTLKQPNGMIITTGPTGSGKTTALYAFLRALASSEVKVITIEDPIEYHLEGVAQTQIEAARGYTFAAALRSVLRQDPDVILVGEIRDRETAETALQAALTGHLVLSTLHTNDASGSIPRLLDLGVKAVSIAPALSLALAQRLVRRLCAACKRSREASEKERAALAKELQSVPAHILGNILKKPLALFEPVGCSKCLGGYKGRVGVFEALFANKELEQLILELAAEYHIRQNALENGMVTLRQDALLKMLEGVTSLEEINRSVGADS
jgi:type II secretory ATPase GspE/PulE/Tfp pilus assembly ATPase PilB-like protein